MKNKNHIVAAFFLPLFFWLPTAASAYSEGYYVGYYEGYYVGYYQTYYQPYYQPYYQSYYQGYYQSTYQTVFTVNASASRNVSITGLVSKGSGSFVIDHPLDPKNKLLYHSFVESPDVKNIYDGIATLDENGEAVIKLPEYFDALNKEPRYLLRPMGQPMPNLYVLKEEKNNEFSIAGGVPGGQVSWQVTGIRHDPFILENPVVVEVEKTDDTLVKKGEYLYSGFEKGSFLTQLLTPFRALLKPVGIGE